MESVRLVLSIVLLSAVAVGGGCDGSQGGIPFQLPQFTVNAAVQGEGIVELVEEEGGVEFTQGAFAEQASVTLTAVAAPGWVFIGWGGDSVAAEDTITLAVDADKTVTAKFVALAGLRTASVLGVVGRMTLAADGNQVRGNWRSGTLGTDIEGTINGLHLQLTSSSPGFDDADIDLTLKEDGSLVGTIDQSGFDNDAFTCDPVALAWVDRVESGQRTTDVDGTHGLLTAVVTDDTVRGTWRVFDRFGADIEGTISDDMIIFTVVIPGFESGTIQVTVQPDGSWVGTIDGSGFANDPFEAQPAFFP